MVDLFFVKVFGKLIFPTTFAVYTYIHMGKLKHTREEFIAKAKAIHGNTYDYSKVIYKGTDHRVIIVCRVHGDFDLRARTHYTGHRGCPKCDTSNKHGFSNRTKWYKLEKSIYLIEVNQGGERFLKFGVTIERDVNKRMQKGQFPYDYRILFEHRSTKGDMIVEIEKEIKNKYKSLKYTPRSFFRGNTECLEYGVKSLVLRDLKSKLN